MRSRQGGEGRRRTESVRVEGASTKEMVYGRNSVREALRGKRSVLAVTLASESAGEAGGVSEQRVTEWCRAAGRKVPRISRVSARDLSELLRTSDHQGVAAEVGPYPYVDEGDLLAKCTLLVALDSVQDPHNLGAVIRSAEACGAGVVIPRHRAAQITPAVVKASAGATEHASVAMVRNLSDFLEKAKGHGFWVYGASAEAAADYYAQDYGRATCFVMGSEGKGLGRRVASLCDVMVRLPLKGNVESLNVSVSAGVLLYEALRQRDGGEAGQD